MQVCRSIKSSLPLSKLVPKPAVVVSQRVNYINPVSDHCICTRLGLARPLMKASFASRAIMEGSGSPQASKRLKTSGEHVPPCCHHSASHFDKLVNHVMVCMHSNLAMLHHMLSSHVAITLVASGVMVCGLQASGMACWPSMEPLWCCKGLHHVMRPTDHVMRHTHEALTAWNPLMTSTPHMAEHWYTHQYSGRVAGCMAASAA